MIQYTPLGGPMRTLVGSNTSGTQIFGLRRPIAVGNDVSHAFLCKKVLWLQIPGPRPGSPWEGHLGSDTSGSQKFDMVFRILGSELASVPNLSPIGESGHLGSTRSWGILGPGPRTPGVDLTLGTNFWNPWVRINQCTKFEPNQRKWAPWLYQVLGDPGTWPPDPWGGPDPWDPFFWNPWVRISQCTKFEPNRRKWAPWLYQVLGPGPRTPGVNLTLGTHFLESLGPN